MLGCKSGRGIYDYGDDAAKDEAELITPAEVAGSSRQVAEQMLSAKPGEMFVLEGVSVGKTAGRTALVESRALGVPVALFDWFSDDSGGPIGFSLSDEQALPAATGVLAGLSRPGVRIADRPGLIVARAFAQIVNAAADAVLEQVADEGGIDAALRFGANYPFGPFAWADRFGRANLIGLLDAIADETGESFYRPSQYVRRWS
jgi:3-hydroxybutyryl-CoA dehydrogenase